MKTRRGVSLAVLFSFTSPVLSGIVLSFSLRGRVAYWSGWTLLGLSREPYTAFHTALMVL